MKNKNLNPSEIVFYQTYKKLKEKSLIQLNLKQKGLIRIINGYSDCHESEPDRYFYMEFNNFQILKNSSNQVFALSIGQYKQNNLNEFDKSQTNISLFPININLNENFVKDLTLFPSEIINTSKIENSIKSFFESYIMKGFFPDNTIKLISKYELIFLGEKKLVYKKDFLKPETLNVELDNNFRKYSYNLANSLTDRIISYLDK